MRNLAIFALFVLSVTEPACNSKKADEASGSAPAAVAASVSPGGAPSLAKDVAAKAARIVFVGKEHACDCTRKKVDTALSGLAQILGEPPSIPIEMLKADTQQEKVEPFRQQRPMLAIPAIYFVDAKGSVLDMLQGEITADQIRHALGR